MHACKTENSSLVLIIYYTSRNLGNNIFYYYRINFFYPKLSARCQIVAIFPNDIS